MVKLLKKEEMDKLFYERVDFYCKKNLSHTVHIQMAWFSNVQHLYVLIDHVLKCTISHNIGMWILNALSEPGVRLL